MIGPLTIRVTPQHVADGERGDPCGCPVALAALDALPFCTVAATVFKLEAFGLPDGVQVGVWTTPHSLRVAICDYGDGGDGASLIGTWELAP